MPTGAPDYLRQLRAANVPYPPAPVEVSSGYATLSDGDQTVIISKVLSSGQRTLPVHFTLEAEANTEFMASYDQGFIVIITCTSGGSLKDIYRRSFVGPEFHPLRRSGTTTWDTFVTDQLPKVPIDTGGSVYVTVWNFTGQTVTFLVKLYYQLGV